jgi:hypothetical protein
VNFVKALGRGVGVGVALSINIDNNGGKLSASPCGRFVADKIFYRRLGCFQSLSGRSGGHNFRLPARNRTTITHLVTIPTEPCRLRAGLRCDQAVRQQWAPKFWWGVGGEGGTNDLFCGTSY